jgi:hypothetical protein
MSINEMFPPLCPEGIKRLSLNKIDITAKTPKMKKHGLNIKLLFADYLEKETFCSEIRLSFN